jgi:hypothetical protein
MNSDGGGFTPIGSNQVVDTEALESKMKKDDVANTAESKPRKSKSFITSAVLAALLVVSLTAGAIFWRNGSLYFGMKEADQQVVLQSSICDNDIVNSYNDIVDNAAGNDNMVANQTADLLDEPSKQPNYKEDPNCMFMAFQTALVNDDYAAAKEDLEAIEHLAESGRHIDSRIHGATDVAMMQLALSAMIPISEFEDEEQ